MDALSNPVGLSVHVIWMIFSLTAALFAEVRKTKAANKHPKLTEYSTNSFENFYWGFGRFSFAHHQIAETNNGFEPKSCWCLFNKSQFEAR